MTRNALDTLDCLSKVMEVVNVRTSVIGLYAKRISKFIETEELDLIVDECTKCREEVQNLIDSERHKL